MKQNFREAVYSNMQREAYEMLSHSERAAFIKSQNPTLKQSVCVTKQMKKRFGPFYWSYKLDNGWRCFASRSKDECVRKYLEFMEKAENELNSDERP